MLRGSGPAAEGYRDVLNFESFSVDEAMIRKIADRSHDLPDYKANPVIADIDEIYRELKDALVRG